MPKRDKPCRVVLTAHAVERYRERAGGKLTVGRVRAALMNKLRTGARVANAAVDVCIGETLQAVCVPSEAGGWVVVTVEPVGGGDPAMRQLRLWLVGPVNNALAHRVVAAATREEAEAQGRERYGVRCVVTEIKVEGYEVRVEAKEKGERRNVPARGRAGSCRKGAGGPVGGGR